MPIEDLKLQIKDTPISRIVGHYIPLTKRGTQTLAICPFHQDTKPSLNVNDSKGMFMCFACNTGGDHITFVEKYRNLNFMDSLEEISKIIGLEFTDYKEVKKQNPDLEMARKILNKAVQIYQKVSLDNPVFLQFLKDRNINKETCGQFKLGYAPGNNIISNYLQTIKDLKKRDHALKIAIELKIIHPDKRREGEFYDSFRDRIMFPIFDSNNNPMGFTSRATKDNQQPKYLNSSESIAFVKKRLLYGINLSKSIIRDKDQIILCEGNMDVITLHQKGFKNAIAIMGTAFNVSIIPTLKTLSKNIILALDSDNAGYEAAKRTNHFLLKEGIVSNYISFLPHKDPDEYLTQKTSMDLQKLIDSSQAFIDFELDKIRSENKPSSIEQKIETIKLATELLSPLGKTVYSTEKLAEFAASIGIKSSPEELLKEFSLNSSLGPVAPQNQVPKTQKVPSHSISTGNYVDEAMLVSKSMELAIREILKNPEIMELEKWGEMLDLLSPNEVKMWFTSIQKLYFEVDDQDFNSMVLDVLSKENVSPEFKSIVGAAIYRSEGRSPLDFKGQNQLLSDLIKRFKKEQLIEIRQELFKKHAIAPTLEQEAILREINNIQLQIKNIN